MSSKSLKFRQYQFQIIRKKNDRKIFHSSAKLIASDSDIDEAFKSNGCDGLALWLLQLIIKKQLS